MKNYLHIFENNSDFSDVYNDNSKYYEPFVSDTLDTDTINYNKYSNSFIFEILTNGYIEFKATDNTVLKTIMYKLNDGDWTSISSSTSGTRINVSSGDSLTVKGDNDSYANSLTSYNTFSGSTAQFNLLGNLLSLISTDKDIYGDYAFANMFINCATLKSIEHLKIVANKAAKYAFYRTFKGCNNLRAVPQIFTIVYGDEYALKEMFMNCTLLKDNIDNAFICEKLEQHTCESMFENCVNLVHSPNLIALTLENSCYKRMFYGCENLLDTNFYFEHLADNCCESMFENCSSLVTVNKLAPVIAKTECYKRMFAGCTSLEKSPAIEINSVTDSTNAFVQMFYNCSSLNEIFIESYNLDAGNQFTNWVYNVASSGTFHKNMTATFTVGVNGIPSSWIIKNLDFREIPFTFKINKGKGNFKFNFDNAFGSNYTRLHLAYSLNSSQVHSLVGNETFYLKVGDIMSIYAEPESAYPSGANSYGNRTFIIDNTITEIDVYGNLLSLSYGQNFYERINDTQMFDMKNFFTDNKALIHAHNLMFPTNLGNLTYYNMFHNCTSLQTIPLLPATNLIQNCYQYMFARCESVMAIPENLLPATVLVDGCYYHMFEGCISLTAIPENLLTSTTLARNCYGGMFDSCSGIVSIPEHLLPATVLVDSCYSSMFRGCTSLESIPEHLLHSTTLAESCYNTMFYRCTSLTSIPEHLLPATTLADHCYDSMFDSCSGIVSIPENLLPAMNLAPYCYYKMFYGHLCVTLPEHLLPATTLADHCYDSMFGYSDDLLSVPKNFLPATTLADHCYYGMFRSCPFLEYGPDLPALTTENYCYNRMYIGSPRLRGIRFFFNELNGAEPIYKIAYPTEILYGNGQYPIFVVTKDINVNFDSMNIENTWQQIIIVNNNNIYTDKTKYTVPTESFIHKISINADVNIRRIQMSGYDLSIHPVLYELSVDEPYVGLYRKYSLDLVLDSIDSPIETQILFENFDENDVKISEYLIYINRISLNFFDFDENHDWTSANMFITNDSPSWSNIKLTSNGERIAKLKLFGYSSIKLTVKAGNNTDYNHLVISKVNEEAIFPDRAVSSTINTWTSYNKSTSSWYVVSINNLNTTILNTIELKWGNTNTTGDYGTCYAYISYLQ